MGKLIMLDVWNVIQNRRSIRFFNSDKLNEEDLKKLILEAGIWAPTAGNSQSWRFIIITNTKTLDKVRLVSPGLLGTPQGLIIICQDLNNAFDKGGELGVKTLSLMDTAMAAQNIMLAAYTIGLGTCPIASFHSESIQKIIGLPSNVCPQLLISVGVPGDIALTHTPRRNSNVVWFNQYEK